MRFSQILTWAQLGLKRGGWSQAGVTGQAEITQIGPAYDLSGQQASDAIYNVAQSEGGRYKVQANGSLVYLERDAGYNLPVSATLSDGTAVAPAALNTDPGFATGLAGWTGGGVTYSPGNRYGSLGALSAAGTVTSPAFTWNGGSASAGFWVQVPSGRHCHDLRGCQRGNRDGSRRRLSRRVVVPAARRPRRQQRVVGQPARLRRDRPVLPRLRRDVVLGRTGPLPAETVLRLRHDLHLQRGAGHPAGRPEPAHHLRRPRQRLAGAVLPPLRAELHPGRDLRLRRVRHHHLVLAGYQQPSLHVSAITVDAASNPLEAFGVVLPLDTGQVALTSRHPVGGAPLSETGTVEQIGHVIGPGYWQTSCQLSPYGPAQGVLCADTAGFDAAGTALVIAWLRGSGVPLNPVEVRLRPGQPPAAQHGPVRHPRPAVRRPVPRDPPAAVGDSHQGGHRLRGAVRAAQSPARAWQPTR